MGLIFRGLFLGLVCLYSTKAQLELAYWYLSCAGVSVFLPFFIAMLNRCCSPASVIPPSGMQLN